MTREVIWSELSLEKIETLFLRIALDNPTAARDMRAKIQDAADRAASSAVTFKQGRQKGTHELVITRNYVLVFALTPETVEVVNLLHTSQQYP